MERIRLIRWYLGACWEPQECKIKNLGMEEHLEDLNDCILYKYVPWILAIMSCWGHHEIGKGGSVRDWTVVCTFAHDLRSRSCYEMWKTASFGKIMKIYKNVYFINLNIFVDIFWIIDIVYYVLACWNTGHVGILGRAVDLVEDI
jgi:hypothetical protein